MKAMKQGLEWARNETQEIFIPTGEEGAKRIRYKPIMR